MVKCTLCGKEKRLFKFGWVMCPNCYVWYCPECFQKLESKGLIRKKKICIRCKGEIPIKK